MSGLVAELADAKEELRAERAAVAEERKDAAALAAYYIARDRPTHAEVEAGTIADQLVRGALSRSAPAMASHRRDGTGY